MAHCCHSRQAPAFGYPHFIKMKAFYKTVLIAGLLGAAVASAELPPLIPREILFGNPERTSPELSPDGKRLAWLAPDTNNVLQVWVKTVGKEDDKIITADKKRGIRQYLWARNNRVLRWKASRAP